MSKYTKYQHPPIKRPEPVHPIWRGIGCILFVIVPIIAYASAVILVNYGKNHGWPIPYDMLGYAQFPDWVWNIPIIKVIAKPFANFNNLYAILFFFLILLVFLSGIFSTIYALIFRIIAPPRYSPPDAPPTKYKSKPYRR